MWKGLSSLKSRLAGDSTEGRGEKKDPSLLEKENARPAAPKIAVGSRVRIVGGGGPAYAFQKGLAAVVVQAPPPGEERGPGYTVELYAPSDDRGDCLDAFLVRQRVSGLNIAQLMPMQVNEDEGLTLVGSPAAPMCSLPFAELHQLGLGPNAVGCSGLLGGLAPCQHDLWTAQDLCGLTCRVYSGPDRNGRYAVHIIDPADDGITSQPKLVFFLVNPECVTLQVRRSKLQQLVAKVRASQREAKEDTAGHILEPSSDLMLEPLEGSTPMPEEAAGSEERPDKTTCQQDGEDGDSLSQGAAVRLLGLTGAVELNGRRGVLVSFVEDSGRWMVDVDGVGIKALRPENLRRLGAARDRKFNALDEDLTRCCTEDIDACDGGSPIRLPAAKGLGNPTATAAPVEHARGGPSFASAAESPVKKSQGVADSLRREVQGKEGAKVKAAEAKERGNVAFRMQDFQGAVHYFTEAISHDPADHILFSNRSACYASLKLYEDALRDASECVRLKPDWPKAYARRGLAEFFLHDYSKARMTYETGLRVAPEDVALKEGLQRAIAAENQTPH
eukprot:gnl/TRDRNA2_/TRDRNA2_81294_c0_seq1.p1 gnl/TRDRNA2_/TRDRNA2_81294_c0~~gnl/TRDRNA2_/TRDRNA2_81294_c0_seq1.p1  ORF type:complete len:560 (+),score=87.35 gnl/TRDRNA2_/TRDRNA2_81294_c0_seq1:48-1727(+)